jgi:DNA-binding IclR family transcriptional regulator
MSERTIQASDCRTFVTDVVERLGAPRSTAERWASILVVTSLLAQGAEIPAAIS